MENIDSIYYVLKPELEKGLYMYSFSCAWKKKGYYCLQKKYNLIRKIFQKLPFAVKCILLFLLQCCRRKKVRLITPLGGKTCIEDIFPYCYKYKIIPYIWDCWPNTWKRVLCVLRILNIKVCFISSSLVCKELSLKDSNIQFIFIPEGIDVSLYMKGNLLIYRSIDVLELGRKHPYYHEKIQKMDEVNLYYNRDGNLVFPTFKSLVNGLSDTKVVICFPRSDTHKNVAGNIETLTQRYWECMLSRCLIVGRAPFELINLIGYNPVIDVIWGQEYEQLKDILNHINRYQEFVDKNYEIALRYASWDKRVDEMEKALSEYGL